jgi:hypothetical protein
MKVCEICGSNRPKANNHFCSMGCRDKAVKPKSAYQCIVCDKPFEAKHKAKYCSLSCRSQGAKLTISGFLSQLLKHRGRNKLLPLDAVMAMYSAQGGLCAVSGCPMTISIRGGRNLTNISIDRIDSSRGYAMDNIQLVCLVVNLMKLDMTQEEFTSWCGAVWNRQNALKTPNGCPKESVNALGPPSSQNDLKNMHLVNLN